MKLTATISPAWVVLPCMLCVLVCFGWLHVIVTADPHNFVLPEHFKVSCIVLLCIALRMTWVIGHHRA